VNDGASELRELGRIVRGLPAKLNLIRSTRGGSAALPAAGPPAVLEIRDGCSRGRAREHPLEPRRRGAGGLRTARLLDRARDAEPRRCDMIELTGAPRSSPAARAASARPAARCWRAPGRAWS